MEKIVSDPVRNLSTEKNAPHPGRRPKDHRWLGSIRDVNARRHLSPEKTRVLHWHGETFDSLRLQRRHVDGEAILYIRLEEPLVGLVDLLDRDDLDLRGDAVLPAEVEHLLGLGDATNEGSGEALAAKEKTEGRDRQRFVRRPDERESAVDGEQVQIGIDVVIGRDRVEDEIETTGLLLHRVRVPGHDHLIGPETQGYTVGRALHSLRAWCWSEWQTPQKRISISTSLSVGSRRGIGA